MSGKVRDRLRAAKWRTWHYDVPVADEDTIEAARAAVALADRAKVMASFDDTADDERAKADADLTAAKAALADCFEQIEIAPLSDDADVDALIEAHPPAEDAPAFNFALFWACLADKRGMDEDEWRSLVGSWPRPDRNALYNLVNEANTRPSYDAIPKG